MGKPEGKRSLDRCRSRWEDNFKTDFHETVSDVVDWINLPQGAGKLRDFVNTVMKLMVIKSVGFVRLLQNISFLRRTVLRGDVQLFS